MIEFPDFEKVQIITATITNAFVVKGSSKLIRLEIDDGSDVPRTILTGMAPWYMPNDFIGMKTLIVSNLKPRQMMGFESNGMLLSIDSPQKPILIRLSDEVENGLPVC